MKIKFFLPMLLLIVSTFLMNGCGINNQARQIKALEKCTYRITEINNITIGGADISNIFKNNEINFAALPGIALGLLSRDVPLKSTISLEISNPTTQTAAINAFEYIIQIGQEEIANGNVETALKVEPNEQKTVPVQINTNIYRLINNPELINKVVENYKKRNSNAELGEITVKIKPTFMLGKSSFKYPGYINIRKKIDIKDFVK